VVLLITAQIVLFGTEFSHAYARQNSAPTASA
jgi:hypothetical protein